MYVKIEFPNAKVAKQYNDYITDDETVRWVHFVDTEYLDSEKHLIMGKLVKVHKFRNTKTGQPMYVPEHEAVSIEVYDDDAPRFRLV